MAMGIGIHLEDVTVDIPILSVSAYNLKGHLTRVARGRGARIETIRALDAVSLQLGPGARLGIVGPNGAGKSTILRVMSGVLTPTGGWVRREGRVAPLLDTNLGMDPEATGYENIVTRGLFLGQTRAAMESRVAEIAEFSELGDRLRHPVHTYSAGMRTRLAFAVVTSLDPEILVMDEGIGVGDQRFAEKARARTAEFIERAGILVLASHSNKLIREFCDTAIRMERGRIRDVGPVDDVLARMAAVRV